MCVPIEYTEDDKRGYNADNPPPGTPQASTPQASANEPVIQQPAAFTPQNETVNSSGGVQTTTPTGGGGGGGAPGGTTVLEDGTIRQGESGMGEPAIQQPAAFDALGAQIAAQTKAFGDIATQIGNAQRDAAQAMRDGFLSLTDQQNKALMAADELRKNTGQQSRKPNYSLSLKNNASRNRAGITSTMLTGVGGISTGDLPLGKASLLGG